MNNKKQIALQCALPMALLAAPAVAQSVTFTRIVDQATPTTIFGHSPSLDAGQVAFLGRTGLFGSHGIYRAPTDGSATPTLIVADTDPIPNVPGKLFTFLDNPEIHSGAVSFTAGWSFSSANNTGIYQGAGGAITVLYDHADPSLGVNPFEPIVDAADTLFRTAGGNSSNFLDASIPVRFQGGLPTPLVSGPLPGGGDMLRLVLNNDTLAMDGGIGVFAAQVNHINPVAVDDGVYTWDSATNAIDVVVNWTDDFPGTTQKFQNFGRVHTDGETVVLVGSVGNLGFGGIQGVFTSDLGSGGAPTTIARVGDLAPGSAIAFGAFGSVAVEGDLVLFEATLGSIFSASESGIYGSKSGQLFRVVDTTQTLLGEDIIGLQFTFRGLDQGQLAIRATLLDPAHPTIHHLYGLYIAEFTEPFADFCSGDGGDQMGCTSCPCSNQSAPGTIGGCLNSAGSSLRIIASGDPSVSLPSGSTTDLQINAAEAPPSSFCILNSGDGVAPGNMANPCFGMNSGAQSISFDGLRCAVQNTRRHGGRSADGNGDIGVTNNPWGGEAGPAVGLANAFGGFVAGQTRYFQVINRDDPLLVCMRGLNTSQAVEVTFTP